MNRLTAVAGRSLADDAAHALIARYGAIEDQQWFARQVAEPLVEREDSSKQTTAIASDWLARSEPVPAGYRAARSHGRAAYEIDLPQATEAIAAGRRQLPIIMENDTKRQIGVCVLQDDGKAITRFSRSAEGQAAEQRFGRGEDALEVAYLQRGKAAAVPAAISVKAVNVGRNSEGNTTMSDAQEMLAIAERHNRPIWPTMPSALARRWPNSETNCSMRSATICPSPRPITRTLNGRLVSRG